MSKKAKRHHVTFLPENKTITVEDRKSIFETILNSNPQNIELRFACGAEGICQKCKIRAFQKMGPLTPTEKGCLTQEEINKGIRLACQARVIQDMKAEIIFKMPFSIRLVNEVLSDEDCIKTRIKKLYIQGKRNRPISKEMFIESVWGSKIVDVNNEKLLQDLDSKFSLFFEQEILKCTAVFIDNDLICLEEGNTKDKEFAAAVDLGINTLMVSLLDLTSGKKVAVVTDTNPQIKLGTNFETRINRVAENPLNLEILNEEILLRIDILILELCRARGISPMHVYEIVISGTTGMLNLFLKGKPDLMEQQPPFDKSTRGSFWAEQLNLKSSHRAKIHTLPVISSYVGADITAGILATQLHRSKETMLFLDLGTAVKAVLHHKGKIIATSISGGEAFECVGIGFGMRPETGAIESVKIDKDIHVLVIGESLPRGICGSGLMELTAELKRIGIIDIQGDFEDVVALGHIAPKILDRILVVNDKKAFRLYTDDGEFQTDIYIAQQDIYLLRESKVCVTAMLKNLFKHMEIDVSDISKVLIGGAFGQRIDMNVFFELGLLPSFLKGGVSFVGNTAKRGAQMALLDKNILKEAEKLAKDVICISTLKDKSPKGYSNFLPCL